jgi:hypothetical protein
MGHGTSAPFHNGLATIDRPLAFQFPLTHICWTWNMAWHSEHSRIIHDFVGCLQDLELYLAFIDCGLIALEKIKN